MKSRTLTLALLAVLLLVMFTAATAATAATAVAEEPYSGGTVAETTITPRIVLAAEGRSVTVTAAGTSEPCTLAVGDDAAGTVTPAVHTYAAEGAYDITATCGALVLARTVSFAKGLNFTGFEVLPYLLVAIALILIGGLMVRSYRRSKATH